MCVLDVGCGRGFLAERINEYFANMNKAVEVFGTDHIIPEALKANGNVKYIASDASVLPFENDSFDTVICTHVLEHVLDFDVVVGELRRVAKQRLIIVVPLQRHYKYTFDLHIRFFPYPHSFLTALRPLETGRFKSETIGGELLFIEEHHS